jgi:hypothetical protein
MESCCSTRVFHREWPSSIAFVVDPTMSVKRTVARTRDSSASSSRTERMNRSISPTKASTSPTHGQWSTPGSTTCVQPGISLAVYPSGGGPGSPSLATSSVGTRIVGRIARTSISWFMRMSVSNAPGLA